MPQTFDRVAMAATMYFAFECLEEFGVIKRFEYPSSLAKIGGHDCLAADELLS